MGVGRNAGYAGVVSRPIDLAGQHQSQTVAGDAKFLAFTLNLAAGPTELRRGAY